MIPQQPLSPEPPLDGARAAARSAPSTPPAMALPRWQVWTGRGLSALPVLMLVMSAATKLSRTPSPIVEVLTGKLGYSAGVLAPLGVIELVSAVLYAVPRTSALGAVLVTGYLGGAIASNVRVGEAYQVPLLLGVLVWAGLYLRDERVRALLPVRKIVRAI